jgi:hypothetical protein
MHRMSAGKAPDPSRAWYLTLGRMLRRNGWASLRRKRGGRGSYTTEGSR